MDIIKDTRRATDFAKFLDNESVRTNPFGQNLSGEQAYRRAERLAAALHLLTNHVRDDEPARSRARLLGHELLASVLLLRDGFRASGGIQVKKTQTIIRELISLVKILAISGHVSFQNAEAVSEALDDLGYFLLAAQRSGLAEANPLSKEDLAPNIKQSKQLRAIIEAELPSETHVRNKMSLKDIKKTNNKGQKKAYRTDEMRSRAETVMGILQGGALLSIKDISAHFPEYSEKTVQRILSTLIDRGTVKHEGMKRWRKYRLVQA